MEHRAREARRPRRRVVLGADDEVHDDIAKVIGAEAIQAKYELGERLSGPRRAESVLICILKGVFSRRTWCPLSIAKLVSWPSALRLRHAHVGRGAHFEDLDRSIEGEHVIIVEDIVDSGLTLSYLEPQVPPRR